MFLVSTLFWLFKCIFSCNHLRTPVNEGKCYCPDCGRGLVYHWVVARCNACQTRLESRTILRQVVPVHRCCPSCGEQSFRFDTLGAPSYFQLQKAQLMVREEQDYLQGRFSQWSLYGWGQAMGRTVEQTLVKTLAWLEPPQPSARVLALLTIRN